MRTLGAIVSLLFIGATAAEHAQTPPAFEIASVRQNQSGGGGQRLSWQTDRLRAENVSLRTLIQEAFGVYAAQIVDAPPWVDEERFDINAKADMPFTSQAGRRDMLKTLLVDRFALLAREDSRPSDNYALTVTAPGGTLGPNLARSAMPCDRADRSGPDDRCGIATLARASLTGQVRVRGMELQRTLVPMLERELRAPVKNDTGLTGEYDWNLQWRPMGFASGPINRERFPNIDPDAPPLPVALREQLGLDLQRMSGTITVIVIERVERPRPD